KVYAQAGVPRTPQEKIADAAKVHELTGVAPSIALHIPWIVAALFLAGAPSAFYWRLVKMRARRTELIRQEFNVPPEQELRDPVRVYDPG
ncbi:MAG: hypothetical protein ACHQ7M_11700, partial [Chloroflexota bacterium]